MTRIIGTVNDPGRVTATILAAVKGAGFDYAGEWDAETTYEKNKVVSIQSRLGIFKSLKAANTGNTPPATTDEWWEVVMAIPGGGVVNGWLPINSDDIPTYGIISYLLSEYYVGFDFLSYKFNQILAPADVWTARATNGATFQVDESATNKNVKGGFYFDGAISEGIQLDILNLNNELFTTKNLSVIIRSKASVTTALNPGVVWGIRGAWIEGSDDVEWSQPVYLKQNLTTAGAIYMTDKCDEIILGGSQLQNASLRIEIFRAVDDANDVNVHDAVFLDAQIFINQ